MFNLVTKLIISWFFIHRPGLIINMQAFLNESNRRRQLDVNQYVLASSLINHNSTDCGSLKGVSYSIIITVLLKRVGFPRIKLDLVLLKFFKSC